MVKIQTPRPSDLTLAFSVPYQCFTYLLTFIQKVAKHVGQLQHSIIYGFLWTPQKRGLGDEVPPVADDILGLKVLYFMQNTSKKSYFNIKNTVVNA